MNKTIKRLYLGVLMMLWSVAMLAQNQTNNHVVGSGETLYSISRQYGVTVNDILNANPGLTENIIAGQTVKIPSASAEPELKKLAPCKTTHIVAKKETIYGISHQYGISQEELIAANPRLVNGKLKKGMELCIPYNIEEKQIHQEKTQQVMEKLEAQRQESLVRYYDVIKIAVIAPFALNESRRSVDAQKMTDFYKGFLMAVDTLKHKGISCEIYAYEEKGSDGSSMSSILSQPALKTVNLIVGPFRPANAAKVAAFAASNNIKMVTPMSTKSYDLTSNKCIFEISAPQSYVSQNVYGKFVDKYSKNNVIFVSMSDNKDLETFNGLKSALKKNNISFKTVNFDDFATFKDNLSSDKTNVVVLSSGSENALKLFTQKLKNKPADYEGYRINLFGYPEWQTHTKLFDQLKKYNAVFFTTFFANPNSSNVIRFNNNFTKWFHRPQVNSFPKYGLLGFDIGNYFVRGLKEKGSALSAKTPVAYEGLQTPFDFIQTNGGAAVNNSVMFVRFNSDGTYSVDK